MFAYLFPYLRSDFQVKPLTLASGIYLVDAGDDDIWPGKKRFIIGRNVCLLVIPELLHNLKLKNIKINFEKNPFSMLEYVFDWFNLFMFFKTHKDGQTKYGYFVEMETPFKALEKYKKKNKFTLFDDTGMVSVQLNNFLFGRDRDLMTLTKEDFEYLKRSKSKFRKYYYLEDAQLDFNKTKVPLSMATEMFISALAADISDPPKLILLVSSLEALFCNSNQELSFRLSHNISWFLNPKSKDYDKRIEIQKTVKKIYNLRSKGIHGQTFDFETDDYTSVINLFSAIFEKIVENEELVSIFENKEKHKAFIGHLEAGNFNLKR